MPTTRDSGHGRLREAVLFFCVTGRLPPAETRKRDGLVEAFRLRHSDLGRPEYLAQLRTIWLAHRSEIVEAAGGGEPWIATVIADPSRLDQEEDDDADGGRR